MKKSLGRDALGLFAYFLLMRRRWDYFVRHLMGAEPPAGYQIGALERPIG